MKAYVNWMYFLLLHFSFKVISQRINSKNYFKSNCILRGIYIIVILRKPQNQKGHEIAISGHEQ
jgi:hypothetical protein